MSGTKDVWAKDVLAKEIPGFLKRRKLRTCVILAGEQMETEGTAMNKTIDYILAVAKYGGITRAAAQLYITPSALSKFVQVREEELQVKLFIREGKKFTLTYAGERYVEMLKTMMAYQQKMDNEMERIASMYMGRLRIGFQMSLAETVITQIIPDFMKEFPDIQIMLEESSANELTQMLKQNELDAVLSLTEEQDPQMNYITIAEGHWVLAVPKQSPLLDKAVKREGFGNPWIDLRLCLGEKMILLGDGQPMRVYTDQIFELLGSRPETNVLVKTTRTALLCVRAGLGITISSDLLIRHHRMQDQIAELSFGEHPAGEHMSLAYSKKSILVEEIRRFAEISRKYINLKLHKR